MTNVNNLVRDFLAQKTIAVVGVSDRRDTGCNLAYRNFKDSGYRVFAVNPRLATYAGQPCYPSLRALPETPDAVFILANPQVADEIVRQCVELGVTRVWMHCMLGVQPGLAAGITSVSREAVEVCRANGIAVIPGTCPNQFLKPNFAHAAMRRLWTLFGLMRLRA
ncbi:MAG: hypothetical protein HFACDABA_01968 [Anaerolineales bacterium]|nr:hypothetical protein [Anaerolineales bacterium]